MILLPLLNGLVASLVPQHAHHQGGTSDGVIQVVVNPEARVAASRTARALPAVRCGQQLVLPVDTHNQTGGPVMLSVQSRPDRSTGAKRFPLTQAGSHSLSIALEATSVPTDVTLTFDAGPGTLDLAWRSEVHLVIQCRD